MVVEFPPGDQRFSGAMAEEIASLVDAGLIQVLDLLVLVKDADGSVEAYEIEDLGDLGALKALEGQVAELLALDDVEHLAAAMEPGSAAGVLVWENSWAAPFAVATRQSGGQLIASGRIPTQAILAAVESRQRTRRLTCHYDQHDEHDAVSSERRWRAPPPSPAPQRWRSTEFVVAAIAATTDETTAATGADLARPHHEQRRRTIPRRP